MHEENTPLEPSLEKCLKGHKNGITAISFSPNEQEIATSSLDNSIFLWKLRGSLTSYRFQGHEEAVMDVAFSPSGKHMASASRDKSVRLWVPSVTGSTGVFRAHSQTVRSVQFTPDESKILTASDDKIIKMWSSDRYKFIVSFVGHTNWVRSARISNDGSVIASCSDDKTARLWDPESGKCIHTYKDQSGHGVCLAWHPSGCYVAVGTSQGNVKLYDVRTHSLVQYYSIHSEAVTQVAFHPSGSYILTASKDGKMKMLDLLEGHPIFTMVGHTGPVNAVSFSPSGDSFASAGEDKQVFLWKTNFTEIGDDLKENIERAPPTQKSTSAPSVKGKKQGWSMSSMTTVSSMYSIAIQKLEFRESCINGSKYWYLCYHTSKYPATSFVHHDPPEPERPQRFQGQPRANSTMTDDNPGCQDGICSTNMSKNMRVSERITLSRNSEENTEYPSGECSSYSVGHISHIPRTPPTPATYTVPNIHNNNVTIGTTCGQDEDLFGMIKLKENDVCYTSGTIEWVGRKRSFPINSGFKLLNESQNIFSHEPMLKKVKRLNQTYTFKSASNINECNCADVLPTVNAIVDHLNALHEAVDLVDLRVNTLENALSND